MSALFTAVHGRVLQLCRCSRTNNSRHMNEVAVYCDLCGESHVIKPPGCGLDLWIEEGAMRVDEAMVKERQALTIIASAAAAYVRAYPDSALSDAVKDALDILFPKEDRM
jgi:hypothetical protein